MEYYRQKKSLWKRIGCFSQALVVLKGCLVLVAAVKNRKSSIFTASFHRFLALSAEKTDDFAIRSAAVIRIGIKNSEISGFLMLFSARMAVKNEKEGAFTATARPARDSSAVSM